MFLDSIGKFKSFTIFSFITLLVAPGSNSAYVSIDFPFFAKITTGTIDRVTPPPVDTPASHALSRGAAGAVGFAGFTANVVTFGTKAASFP